MIRFAFAISILVAVGVAFAACGGSDDSPLSEEEYFDRLGELTSSSDAAAEPAGDAPPEEHEAWEDWILNGQVIGTRAQAEAFADFIEELEALQPPDTLRDVHTRFISATKAMWLALGETLAHLEQLESLHESSEARDAVEGSLLAAAEQQFEACKALEDASSGSFSCLTDGICYSDLSRAAVVGCSSDGTGGSEILIAPGITGRLRDVPPLPDGYEALSAYIVFEFDDSGGLATIGMPLNRSMEDAADLGWYSYESGEWQRLDVPVRVANGGTIAEGDFEAIPATLVVLREK